MTEQSPQLWLWIVPYAVAMRLANLSTTPGDYFSFEGSSQMGLPVALKYISPSFTVISSPKT
ncbi:hypothetical protein EVA_15934 [gut metagenome]|uniref:Uncharacterized protein n=1 Tax=gut metagenome TaxID=749906 RepID=J9G920_9ZZZZ